MRISTIAELNICVDPQAFIGLPLMWKGVDRGIVLAAHYIRDTDKITIETEVTDKEMIKEIDKGLIEKLKVLDRHNLTQSEIYDIIKLT